MSDKWRVLNPPTWDENGCSLSDLQVGGEASVRYATVEPHKGRYKVVEFTYGVMSTRGLDEDWGDPVGPFYVGQQYYVGVCRDLEDIGGTEEDADYPEQDDDEFRYDTLEEASARARELAESTMNPNDYWPDPWAEEEWSNV